MDALIFDMDGVIVDTEPMWRIAERAVFQNIGLDLSDADCEKTMGMRTDQVVAYWFGQSPWSAPTCDVVARRIEDHVRNLIIERAQPMAGLTHAIQLARESRLRIALASSSCPEIIAAVLDTLQLDGVFDAVRSAISEPLGKPHPGVFLSTASELNVDPGRCSVIEDSIAGVQAGLAAGMRVIAIPPSNYFDHPAHDAADFKLNSLAELTTEMITRAR